MIIAAVLTMSAVVGGTLAGFNTQINKKGVANISVDAVGIALNDSTPISVPEIAPGEQVDMGRFVTNTENYPMYIRVVIDKKWVPTDACSDVSTLNPKYIEMFGMGTGGLFNLMEKAVEIQSGETINGWLVVHADDEQIVMIYNAPVAPGGVTGEFLKAVGLNGPGVTSEYAGASYTIDITADAVQSTAADKSMVAEWGLYPTIDGDGFITAITE